MGYYSANRELQRRALDESGCASDADGVALGRARRTRLIRAARRRPARFPIPRNERGTWRHRRGRRATSYNSERLQWTAIRLVKTEITVSKIMRRRAGLWGARK